MDQTQDTNDIRAHRARVAIDVYLGLPGVDPDCPIRDLLADMMHFCVSRGIDFDRELKLAVGNFEAEK